MDATLKQEIIDLIKSMQQHDSIEIGNSKTGVIKVYCDFSKPIEAGIKIQEAITILKSKREQVLGE
jgi:hypothetical protein